MGVNLPTALLQFGLAPAKHDVKKVIDDEAIQQIAATAAAIRGQEVKAKVDSILGNKEGEKHLLRAAKVADKRFIKKCKNKDFHEQELLLSLVELDCLRSANGG